MTSTLEMIQDLLIEVLEAKNKGREFSDRELEILDGSEEVMGGILNESN